MAVLIDTAMWPAHGTLFCHLISDRTLDELHSFAAANGLSPRSFDRDHYDVPAAHRDRLVRAGAMPVGNREFVRRLASSGLRLPRPASTPRDGHAGLTP